MIPIDRSNRRSNPIERKGRDCHRRRPLARFPIETIAPAKMRATTNEPDGGASVVER
jgi:hypothetical protein